MKEPKFWGSVFSLKVLDAYEAGRLTYEADSIRRWYDTYCGEMYRTKIQDIRDIRSLIDYYKEGNDLPNRAELRHAVDVQNEVKVLMGSKEANSHEVGLKVFDNRTGENITDRAEWHMDSDGTLHVTINIQAGIQPLTIY